MTVTFFPPAGKVKSLGVRYFRGLIIAGSCLLVFSCDGRATLKEGSYNDILYTIAYGLYYFFILIIYIFILDIIYEFA